MAVAIASILMAYSGSVQAQEDAERRPGDYVVWASVDNARCERILGLVNQLPSQDVAAASENNVSGFLRWLPGPRIDTGIPTGGSPVFFILDFLHLDINGSGRKKYAVRNTFMLGRVDNQSLHVVDALPITRGQVGEMLSREPVFSATARNRITRLQEIYGESWKDWYIGSQVLISAFVEQDQPVFFASETVHDLRSSNRLAVFSLDHKGERKDVCMLRRICGCAEICTKPLHTTRERDALAPSAKFCKRP
jgi:hypothetical protein